MYIELTGTIELNGKRINIRLRDMCKHSIDQDITTGEYDRSMGNYRQTGRKTTHEDRPDNVYQYFAELVEARQRELAYTEKTRLKAEIDELLKAIEKAEAGTDERKELAKKLDDKFSALCSIVFNEMEMNQ